MQVRQALHHAGDIGILRWEGPLRSLGSIEGSKRFAIRGYLPSSLPQVDVRLMIMRLKSQRILGQALIGQLALFTDCNSKLVDIRASAALEFVDSLIDEVVLASPRLAIIRTLAPKASWQEALTHIANQDESLMIESVRERLSAGGRPWAKPACLVQARLKMERTCPNAQNIVVMRVPGLLGAHPKESLDRLVRAAAMRLGRAWEEVSADSVLECAQWQHSLDAEGNPSGRIFLCLQSADEVGQVKSSLAGAVVSLGAEPRLLSVEPFVQMSKNDNAGHGSRSHGRPRNAGKAGNRANQ